MVQTSCAYVEMYSFEISTINNTMPLISLHTPLEHWMIHPKINRSGSFGVHFYYIWYPMYRNKKTTL